MTARVLIGSAILALTACGARLPAVRSIAPPVVATAAPVAPVPDTTPVAVAPAPIRPLVDRVIDALCAAPAPRGEATVTVDGRTFVALTHPCRAGTLDRTVYWDTYVREDTTLSPRVTAERRPEM